jgi:hypothetical protein
MIEMLNENAIPLYPNVGAVNNAIKINATE